MGLTAVTETDQQNYPNIAAPYNFFQGFVTFHLLKPDVKEEKTLGSISAGRSQEASCGRKQGHFP